MLAVCQVTLVVTSTVCPPAVAIADKQSVVVVELTGRLNEVMCDPLTSRTMLVTFPRVTVAVVVAVAVPEAAVIVAVPALTPVNKPPVLTVATVLERAGNSENYEFQRLHGMGDALYAVFLERHPDAAVRTYAPVGVHQDLLAYLHTL